MVVANTDAIRAFHFWWPHCLRSKLGDCSLYIHAFLDYGELSSALGGSSANFYANCGFRGACLEFSHREK